MDCSIKLLGIIFCGLLLAPALHGADSNSTTSALSPPSKKEILEWLEILSVKIRKPTVTTMAEWEAYQDECSRFISRTKKETKEHAIVDALLSKMSKVGIMLKVWEKYPLDFTAGRKDELTQAYQDVKESIDKAITALKD